MRLSPNVLALCILVVGALAIKLPHWFIGLVIVFFLVGMLLAQVKR